MTTLLDEWPSRIHHAWRCTRPDDRRRIETHELEDGRRVEHVRCIECGGSDLAWRLAQLLDPPGVKVSPQDDRDCGRCHHPLDSLDRGVRL